MKKRTGLTKLLILSFLISSTFIPKVANANCSSKSSLLHHIKILEKKIDKVMKQNQKLQKEVKGLRQEIKELEKEFKKHEKKIDKQKSTCKGNKDDSVNHRDTHNKSK